MDSIKFGLTATQARPIVEQAAKQVISKAAALAERPVLQHSVPNTVPEGLAERLLAVRGRAEVAMQASGHQPPSVRALAGQRPDGQPARKATAWSSSWDDNGWPPKHT